MISEIENTSSNNPCIRNRFTSDELRAARLRLERARFITNEYEIGRLKVRLGELRAPAAISDCWKSILKLRIGQ